VTPVAQGSTDRPITIAIDASRAVVPQTTGTEQYAAQIIRHLTELPEAAKHRWLLYTRGENAPSLREQHPLHGLAPTAEWRPLPARSLWTHISLNRALARHAPDALFVPAHVLPWRANPASLPPSVVTVHDLGYLRFPDAHRPSQRLYLDQSTRYAARYAHSLIAVSEATAGDLQSAYHVPRSRIHVVHEAATPIEECTPQQIGEVRARLGLERRYALFIGTIQPRKNLGRLLQAYALLRSHHAVDFDLVIAGAPGWGSDPIYQEARSLGLGDRLHFPGYIAQTDLAPLLRGAEQFCYPSLFEGFGLPVLEAQSVGVPVLTSNNSSLPEIAGDAALLVDPMDVDAIADAMLRLSRDEALRSELIAAGYQNVRRFTWQEAARQTLEVLLDAARSR
jgi:glycosyltransferase involved in cell wall biosynthesis